MKSKKAKAFVQIENNLVRITKYLFLPGEETGIHKHELDYIVTPITDGEILLIDNVGNKNFSTLKASESYFRKAGVEHNVINYGKHELIFVKIELKNKDKL